MMINESIQMRKMRKEEEKWKMNMNCKEWEQ
jgi:hypothetical protein